jgi:hypothetical protein
MTYQRIATTTVGVTASTITFSAIPATYTDLWVVLSARTSGAGNGDFTLNFSVNATPTITRRTLYSGAAASPIIETASAATATTGTTAQSGNASVFSNTSIRIMDYTSTTVKMAFVEDGFNYFGNGLAGFSGLYIDNAIAITSITLSDASTSTFLQNSTATLYGILKGGSAATITTT